MAFTFVPVINIHKDNLAIFWPKILASISESYFIAIDLEYTGIGERKKINANSIEERYAAMSELAKSRAIISLGLSCFKLIMNEDSETSHHVFESSVFNILVLCSENFTVEPGSLRFLVEHGFDFNKQFTLGIPYSKGNDEKVDNKVSIRNLFNYIILRQKPLVIHNGFLDLVFIYQNIYCNLPSTLQTFIADLAQMFPNGVYDTKYLTEFHVRLQASFLEYVFRYRQRENYDKMEKGKKYIDLVFDYTTDDIPHIEKVNVKLNERNVNLKEKSVCKGFANHGWCENGKACKRSHLIDDIIDLEFNRSHKLKNIILKQNGDELKSDKPNMHFDSGMHTAGMDAFMTGFIFATYLGTRLHNSNVLLSDLKLDHIKNNVYLMGKNIPLKIIASSFSKPSASHSEKYRKIMIATV